VEEQDEEALYGAVLRTANDASPQPEQKAAASGASPAKCVVGRCRRCGAGDRGSYGSGSLRGRRAGAGTFPRRAASRPALRRRRRRRRQSASSRRGWRRCRRSPCAALTAVRTTRAARCEICSAAACRSGKRCETDGPVVRAHNGATAQDASSSDAIIDDLKESIGKFVRHDAEKVHHAKQDIKNSFKLDNKQFSEQISPKISALSAKESGSITPPVGASPAAPTAVAPAANVAVSDAPAAKNEAKPAQEAAAAPAAPTASKLNVNAKEFKLNPSVKPFVPGGSSAPTPAAAATAAAAAAAAAAATASAASAASADAAPAAAATTDKTSTATAAATAAAAASGGRQRTAASSAAAAAWSRACGWT